MVHLLVGLRLLVPAPERNLKTVAVWGPAKLPREQYAIDGKAN
jgi:hypothetical protein